MTELKPCPFCGGEAESDLMQPFRHYRTGEPLCQPAVYCTSCSAQIAHYPGDVDLSRDDTMELAIAAWNTRQPAATDAVRVAVEALADAAAAAITGLPEMLERNALTDEEGMVAQIEMALSNYRAALASLKETRDAD